MLLKGSIRSLTRPKGGLWQAAARDFVYHGCLKTLQLGVHQLPKGRNQIVREKYRPAG